MGQYSLCDIRRKYSWTGRALWHEAVPLRALILRSAATMQAWRAQPFGYNPLLMDACTAPPNVNHANAPTNTTPHYSPLLQLARALIPRTPHIVCIVETWLRIQWHFWQWSFLRRLPSHTDMVEECFYLFMIHMYLKWWWRRPAV